MVWLCWVDSSSRALCIGRTLFKAKITFDLPGAPAAVPVHSVVSQPAILLQTLHASIGLGISCGEWSISRTAQGPGMLSHRTKQNHQHCERCEMCWTDVWPLQPAPTDCTTLPRTRVSSLEAQSASVPPSQCSLTGPLQNSLLLLLSRLEICFFVFFQVSVANSGRGWFIYPFPTVRSVSQRVSVGGAWLLEWR